MIVRVMGQGQWEVPDSLVIRLNVLDELVSDAVVSRDEEALASVLDEMADLVARHGVRVPPGKVGLSDLIVPNVGTSLREVDEWLQESREDDGLIPG